jgi:hypothetical protein
MHVPGHYIRSHYDILTPRHGPAQKMLTVISVRRSYEYPVRPFAREISDRCRDARTRVHDIDVLPSYDLGQTCNHFHHREYILLVHGQCVVARVYRIELPHEPSARRDGDGLVAVRDQIPGEVDGASLNPSHIQ